MAFSYWRTGNFNGGAYRAPANQGSQGTQTNTGYDGYGYQFRTQGMGSGWGRDKWNKWAWSGSCLRALSYTGPLPRGIAITNNNNTLVEDEDSSTYLITKVSGANGVRDAAAVSSTGAAADFVLRIRGFLSGTNDGAAGVNTDPLTDDNYTSIDFGWWYRPAAQLWSIIESGAFIAVDIGPGAYAWIWRVGTTLGYGRGTTLAAAQASPDRTTTSAATLYFDSAIPDIGESFEVQFYVPALNIVADVGVYTLSGVAAGVTATRRLAGAVGAYAVTGTATGLKFGHNLPATPGAYAINGVATGAPVLARKLLAAVGAYTISGQATGLLATRKLAAAVGVYAITGQATALRRGFTLAGAVGAYAITGIATGLKAARRLVAAVGAYAVTGQATGLKAARRLAAAVGVYAVSGQTVGLKATRKLAVVPGAYALSGQTVGLGGQRKLAIVVGAYAYTGQAVSLSYGHFQGIVAAPGVYTITGAPAALKHTLRLACRPGNYNYYGYPVTLRLVRTLFIPNNAPAAAGAFAAPTAPVLAAATFAATPLPPQAFVKATAPPAVDLE